MKQRHKTLAAAAAAMLAQSAGAVTTPVFTGNVLTGANRLVTDLGTFDVTFTRGTCAEVFGNAPCVFGGTPFMFTNSQALTVATALNSFMLGQDKTKLQGYNGQNTSTAIYTPFTVTQITQNIFGNIRVTGAQSVVWGTSLLNSNIGPNVVGNSINLTRTTLFATYAPSAPIAALPEPATWLQMVLGFGMAGVALRRKTPQRGTVTSQL